ncbi:MAG: GtrA family protein [Myxococcota bacterium]
MPRALGAPGRFLLLGGLSFSLNLGITAALHEIFGVSPEVSFAVALVAVFCVNFAIMRCWVFRGTSRPIRSQLAGFGVSSLFFRGLEYAGYFALFRYARFPYLVAALTVIGISFTLKYVVYNFWLFSREKT